jgi:predicted kinase
VSLPTRIVVVTGPPASGKTTLATAIAEGVGLPVFAKDAIKERLYDALGPGDREWSMRLGRATYPLLFDILSQELRAARSVVVDATFGPPMANEEFAALHRHWPFDALQLYCTAPRDVLLARYAARAPARHPGHLDGSIQDEVAAALDDGRWSPLTLPGRCITIDTTGPVGETTERAVALVRDHIGPRVPGSIDRVPDRSAAIDSLHDCDQDRRPLLESVHRLAEPPPSGHSGG